MGKLRRYKKKLAKAAGAVKDDAVKNQEQLGNVDYLELAEELMSLKKDDDKMSVNSVVKSLKSNRAGESLTLKKDSKRYLKHAFLLKRLEKTQKSLNKNNKKKKSGEDDDSDDNNDEDMSNQKVLNWPVGSLNYNSQSGPPKKYRKGFQKKQNAQLAKDLALFSKKIKRQSKHSVN